jgi:hypothetical protein
MGQERWASLNRDVNVNIRRGAWYRVLRLGAHDAVLEVNRRPLSVPRNYLSLSLQPPRSWTVVPRPLRSARLPPSWGDAYAVCPACRERAPLPAGRPRAQRCRRCNGFFTIAWTDASQRTA